MNTNVAIGKSVRAIPFDAELCAEVLGQHYPWTPHDFVRQPATFFEADRAIFVRQLTRPLDPADDLRFIWDTGDQEIAVLAERLPWDSDFFGYGVARLNGVFPLTPPYNTYKDGFYDALHYLLQHAQAAGIKYLFAPVFVEDLALLHTLGMLGFWLIETRAYYHCALTHYEYPERFAVRPATPDDIPTLAETAANSINHFDRFHADPFIRREDRDRLMRKWVENSILRKFASITLVPDVPNPEAFCTVRYHQEHWAEWGLNLAQTTVLTAVAPAFSGWHQRLISEINYHLKALGAAHTFCITQLTNRAVIHSWEKLGYQYGRGQHILRITL